MGKRFLRSIVRDQTTLAVVGDIAPIDLPVNPLSFLVLTIGLERPDQSATAAQRIMSDVFLGVGEVSVRHKGEMILQGLLADLTMVNGCLHNYSPHGAFLAATGQEQTMSFVLAFSRKPYWPKEGFPATSRGNLQFFLNVLDASPGSATAMSMQLEAVELIQDDPTQYIKYTTQQRTLTATGRQRTSLPIGNELAGVLLFNPATEITATEQSAWGKVKVLVDNVEQYYAESNWEALRADLAMRLTGPATRFGHTHAQLAADNITGDEILNQNRPPVQYGWLDFDPLRDDYYLLETAGHADVDLDLNSDVSTGTARYLPVELVRVKA